MRKFIDLFEGIDWLDQDGNVIPDKVNQHGRPHNWADDTAQLLHDLYVNGGKEAAEAEWQKILTRDKPDQISSVVVIGRFKELLEKSNISIPKPDTDAYGHNRIWKSTWTEWRDRDGIYVQHQGSNSVYVGFSHQAEAEAFAHDMGKPWKVYRNGLYRNSHDDDALLKNYEIRHNRINYGMTVPPIDNSANVIWQNMSKIDKLRVVDELDKTYTDAKERTRAAIQHINDNIEKYR